MKKVKKLNVSRIRKIKNENELNSSLHWEDLEKLEIEKKRKQNLLIEVEKQKKIEKEKEISLKNWLNQNKEIDLNKYIKLWETTAKKSKDAAVELAVSSFAFIDGVEKANDVLNIGLNFNSAHIDTSELIRIQNKLFKLQLFKLSLMGIKNISNASKMKIFNLAIEKEFVQQIIRDSTPVQQLKTNIKQEVEKLLKQPTEKLVPVSTIRQKTGDVKTPLEKLKEKRAIASRGK